MKCRKGWKGKQAITSPHGTSYHLESQIPKVFYFSRRELPVPEREETQGGA
ncbi:MAG: hypothetical protein KA152_09505 [Verrucomicrobiales bacterium]|nr:hypothetical protein [Verrucomicrobiales bacterium]HQW28002.1 hypothetical protein [Verrucomicrobiales bacterium]